jgi:transcription initiation factor TFIIIB Brf1 subunit/transcription initiation factor TFIIB
LEFDLPIFEQKKIDKKERDTPEPLYNEFFSPLSPDMEYRHIYALKANNQELNRALWRQKMKYRKTEDYFYNKDHTEIGRICAALQLPFIVRQEAFNLRLQIGKSNLGYFKKKNALRCIAIVKLACKIRDCPIDEKDLISLTKTYIKEDVKINLRNDETKRKVDKEYVELRKKVPDLKFPPIPDHPQFIAYACDKLGLDQKFETQVYKVYSKIKKSFRPEYSLKGYILALIYLLDTKRRVKFKDLEKGFNISSATLLARRKEILYKNPNLRGG